MVIWFYPIKATDWPKLFSVLRIQDLKYLQPKHKKFVFQSADRPKQKAESIARLSQPGSLGALVHVLIC